MSLEINDPVFSEQALLLRKYSDDLAPMIIKLYGGQPPVYFQTPTQEDLGSLVTALIKFRQHYHFYLFQTQLDRCLTQFSLCLKQLVYAKNYKIINSIENIKAVFVALIHRMKSISQNWNEDAYLYSAGKKSVEKLIVLFQSNPKKIKHKFEQLLSLLSSLDSNNIQDCLAKIKYAVENLHFGLRFNPENLFINFLASEVDAVINWCHPLADLTPIEAMGLIVQADQKHHVRWLKGCLYNSLKAPNKVDINDFSKILAGNSEKLLAFKHFFKTLVYEIRKRVKVSRYVDYVAGWIFSSQQLEKYLQCIGEDPHFELSTSSDAKCAILSKYDLYLTLTRRLINSGFFKKNKDRAMLETQAKINSQLKHEYTLDYFAANYALNLITDNKSNSEPQLLAKHLARKDALSELLNIIENKNEQLFFLKSLLQNQADFLFFINSIPTEALEKHLDLVMEVYHSMPYSGYFFSESSLTAPNQSSISNIAKMGLNIEKNLMFRHQLEKDLSHNENIVQIFFKSRDFNPRFINLDLKIYFECFFCCKQNLPNVQQSIVNILRCFFYLSQALVIPELKANPNFFNNLNFGKFVWNQISIETSAYNINFKGTQLNKVSFKKPIVESTFIGTKIINSGFQGITSCMFLHALIIDTRVNGPLINSYLNRCVMRETKFFNAVNPLEFSGNQVDGFLSPINTNADESKCESSSFFTIHHSNFNQCILKNLRMKLVLAHAKPSSIENTRLENLELQFFYNNLETTKILVDFSNSIFLNVTLKGLNLSFTHWKNVTLENTVFDTFTTDKKTWLILTLKVMKNVAFKQGDLSRVVFSIANPQARSGIEFENVKLNLSQLKLFYNLGTRDFSKIQLTKSNSLSDEERVGINLDGAKIGLGPALQLFLIGYLDFSNCTVMLEDNFWKDPNDLVTQLIRNKQLSVIFELINHYGKNLSHHLKNLNQSEDLKPFQLVARLATRLTNGVLEIFTRLINPNQKQCYIQAITLQAQHKPDMADFLKCINIKLKNLTEDVAAQGRSLTPRPTGPRTR